MIGTLDEKTNLKQWLRKQPINTLSVFSSRAILRAFPLYAELPESLNSVTLSENLLLPKLWATSMVLSAGIWADNDLKLEANANAAYKLAGSHIASKASQDAAAAVQAAVAIIDTIYFDNAAPADAAFSVARFVADAASSDAAAYDPAYANAASSIIYDEYLADRNFIETGKTAEDLSTRRLWANKSSTYKLLNDRWRRLKNYLLSLDQDWHVWTAWYEDRLRGNAERPFTLPFNQEIEIGDPENGQYGRVTFPPEDYKDPAKVNAQIKQVIEDFWERQGLLEQDKKAETFGLNVEGQITRTTSETSSELADTPEQRDWYKSLRQAALGMRDIGENALGKAARPVNNVLEALPADINNAKVARLWPAANRIRKLKAAHERAIDSEDEYHPNRLADEVFDDIGQFVEVYNNLVIGDAGLSEKDKAAKGPEEPEADINAREAAAQGIETAIEYGLFDEEAQIVIEDDIAEEREILAKIEAEHSLTVLESFAQANIQIAKENGIRAIILRVRESEKYGKIEDGALLAIGASVVTYIGIAMPALLGLVRSIFGL